MNLIYIVFDTLRPDYTALQGGKAKTPAIKKLAKESAVFKGARPESLPTIPARRALHTGRRSFPFHNYIPRKGDPVQLPGWMPMPEEQPTVAEVLLEAGYRTALLTDNWHLVKPSMNFLRGFTQWELVRGQVLDFYRSNRLAPEQLEPWVVDKIRGTAAYEMLAQFKANTWNRTSEIEWSPAQTFLKAADWLVQNRDAEKFFLCIESFDPHEPWDAPQDYVDRYDPGYKGKKVISPLYGSSDYLSAAELNHIRALYAGEVSLVDRWLGYFLEKVEALNLLDDTLIVVVSDHGICLGEHELIGKLPWGMFPEVMNIVSMVRPPKGILGGRDIDAMVYNVDLVPTIFDYLGVTPAPLDGASLRGLIEGKESKVRDHLTSRFLGHIWVQTERYWYIATVDGHEQQLFDLQNDPHFKNNISQSAPDIAAMLHNKAVQDAGGSIPVYDTPPVSALGASWYKQFQMNLQGGAMGG
jgi:arylsulfatase A-like enzyme